MSLMDDFGTAPEPEYAPSFDLDKAVEEAKSEEEASGENKLHISEDVIQEIARRALAHITSVVPASAGSSPKAASMERTIGSPSRQACAAAEYR